MRRNGAVNSMTGGVYVNSGSGIVIGFPLFLALALRQVPAIHAAVVTGVLPLATALALLSGPLAHAQTMLSDAHDGPWAAMPDGPERMAKLDQLRRIGVAYMPYKVHVHRIWTDLAQPWVTGYHRNIYVREFWKYVDIDLERLQKEMP